jgi:hypothetical protein
MTPPDNWPFRTHNGEQTPQSKALEQAKPQRPVRDDMDDFEEATW